MPLVDQGEFQGPDDGRRLEPEGDGRHGQLGDEPLAPRIVQLTTAALRL